MTHEERLLLRLVRGDVSETEHGLDWRDVLRLARRHEVVPLVHRSIERLEEPDIPPDVRDAFAAGRRTVAARNGLLVRELGRGLRLFDAAGVPAMPLKGVVLADRLYGDQSLRDCSDMDVLVPRERAREALGLLRADGYAAEFTETFFESVLLRGHIEYTLMRREGSFEHVLDLHWGIGWSAEGDRRAADALWAKAHPVRLGDVPMWQMTPEWEFLTLAVHAARHGWRPLKWLVDIHDYCGQTLDWSQVRETAEQFDWAPAVEQTFGVCRLLFDMPIPRGFSPVQPRGWRASLEPEREPDVTDTMLALRVIARPRKARYLLGQLLLPTLAERRFVRLPPALRLLYYPIRPVRLTGKWAWRFLQRVGALHPRRSGSCVLASRQP